MEVLLQRLVQKRFHKWTCQIQASTGNHRLQELTFPQREGRLC